MDEQSRPRREHLGHQQQDGERDQFHGNQANGTAYLSPMAEAAEKDLVLDHQQVQRKLERIAHQLHEQFFRGGHRALVGVAPRGAKVNRLARLLEAISDLAVERVDLKLDKDRPWRNRWCFPWNWTP